MTRIRRLGAISLGLALTVTLAVPASPALAAPSTSDRQSQQAAVPDLYLKQVPLAKAASVIKNELERGAAPGFAGIALEDDHVALWWKGALPERVRRAVTTARSTAAVKVGAAAYSLAELRAAGNRVRGALRAEKPRVKYAVDGSRIVVGMDVTAGFDRAAVPQVGVPVEIVDQGQKVNTSRYDDWAPWAGGGDNINYSQGSRCTGGFGVRNGANQRFLLTAGHCGSNGNGIYDGAGEYIGNFTADNDTHDLGLVATPAGAINQMYVGDLNSNAVLNVEGWDWVYPGEYLCQSGGSSARDIGGPVCNLRVEKFNTDPGDAVEARQVNGQPAVRGGDSGGPVYSYSASGNAIAKGINCYTYVGNNTILGFQDFGTATRDYGIWIAVG
ncbi:peptidase [Actinoplanes sp. NPDC051633]|uniref:peptidase n=1 Tax=Actinoplanes sp. NPDC051633 TaxID=3155670 RepID=UPI00343D18A4